jgi:pimeloyl-ACP methyl ester carboxylesterase
MKPNGCWQVSLPSDYPIPAAAADGSLVVMTHNTVTPVPVGFDDAGRGEPALVYLTGWCGARTSYAAMVEHTARHYRSIAIDWRGHGTSPAA